jgi:hypothetical protein
MMRERGFHSPARITPGGSPWRASSSMATSSMTGDGSSPHRACGTPWASPWWVPGFLRCGHAERNDDRSWRL